MEIASKYFYHTNFENNRVRLSGPLRISSLLLLVSNFSTVLRFAVLSALKVIIPIAVFSPCLSAPHAET